MTTEPAYREMFIDVAARAIREKLFREHDAEFGTDHVPDVRPGEYREYAAQLYGMLIERNGPFGAVAGAARYREESLNVTIAADPSDFIRAIVTEALGGAKVEEAYGKILILPSPYLSRHKQFSVPHLVIEGGVS